MIPDKLKRPVGKDEAKFHPAKLTMQAFGRVKFEAEAGDVMEAGRR